ncbi:MAG: glycerol-3-phosphate 1-O-acyltransferase PlsY [Candidatus Eremiobacteraeota bacterium]|nr:glycerol-3-phosphate 1-O-acyltransferase PlsY [Candidatus Eremiobacteraeota bacterium]
MLGWPYVLFAFLIGSIPFGVLVSRLFFKRDIRASGSGNIGAVNALRTLGTGAGAAVLLLDALKGVVAVEVAAWLLLRIPLQIPYHGGEYTLGFPRQAFPLMPIAGLAAVYGHCYTPWLRLRGGKGVATFLGATFALAWPAGVAFVAVWFAIVLACGWASLGSIAGVVVAGLVLVVLDHEYGASGLLYAFLCAFIVIVKHRENIARWQPVTRTGCNC